MHCVVHVEILVIVKYILFLDELIFVLMQVPIAACINLWIVCAVLGSYASKPVIKAGGIIDVQREEAIPLDFDQNIFLCILFVKAFLV